METLLQDTDFSPAEDEETKVRNWRAHQLWRLGMPRLLAEAFADDVDWHDVAALVARGCPIFLAVDIAR